MSSHVSFSAEVKMKLRIISMSLLLLVLALSGFAEAQQASSNSGATAGQAAPVSQSTDTKLEPLPPQTSQDFWDGEEPNVGNLIRHPFATKAYIKRHTEPIRDRLSELNELTASNAAQIKDIDARAQRGLQLSSDKANTADQHATDAGNKAQVAKLSAGEAATRVSTAEQRVGNLDQYKPTAQTEIRFSSGQSQLSKQAKDALDQMATPLKDQHNYVVEVQGYSAGHGQAAIAASQKMADSVVRYLVLNHQVPVYRIYALAMGDAGASAEGGSSAKPAHGGRVEVNLLKNNQ
jgi:outer membrane protein OmpA-like peptidoglycan-associated protein